MPFVKRIINNLQRNLETIVKKLPEIEQMKQQLQKHTDRQIQVRPVEQPELGITNLRVDPSVEPSVRNQAYPEQEEERSHVLDQYEKYHKSLFKNKQKAEKTPKRVA